MNPEKKYIVDQLLSRIQNSPFLILVDYTGMTVPQFNEVRKRLRESGASFHVTKNSYVKAAGEARKFPEELNKDLSGQTAIVFGENDICKAAKVLKNFSAEFQKPGIKSGVLDGELIDAEKVIALGAVGSKEDLLSTLLGVLNAPASALARVINAHVEKQGAPVEEAPAAEAEAPAAEAEAPAAEAPAAEAAAPAAEG